MPHAGIILGIRELKVDSVDRQDTIKVYARPTNRPNCVHCGGCDLKIKATYQRYFEAYQTGQSAADAVSQNAKVLLPGRRALVWFSLCRDTAQIPIYRSVSVRSL